MKKVFPAKSKWGGLLGHLQGLPFVYLQTHNFPDHDAVAAAYGLQRLLALYDICSSIVYKGALQRSSLRSFVEHLEIPLKNRRDVPMTADDRIIIIDGCKGNKNVSDLIGEEIAVIDHHETSNPDIVPWSDIRPDLGSTSTLIHSYWKEANAEIPPEIATALIIGLLVDTAHLTRRISPEDIAAFADLHALADMTYVNRLLRNNIQKNDLVYFREAVQNLQHKGRVGFCYLKQGCDQNLLGILADFFLTIREIELIMLCSELDDAVYISIRSENQKWSATAIIQQVLEGVGFGGGHNDMAGGVIRNKKEVTSSMLQKRLHQAAGV